MKRVIALCLSSWLFAVFAFAQVSEHERLSVDGDLENRVEAALACSWDASALDWSLGTELAIEYERKGRASLRLSIPVQGSYEGSRALRSALWELEDPVVSAAYLWRGERLRTQAGLGYSFPMPRRQGPGFHAILPSFSLGMIRDPTILTLGLDLRLCLPRSVDGYLLWPPLSAGLCLSSWELLNDRIGYRVSLLPGFSLGSRRVGLGDPLIPRWSLGLALSLSWNERRWGLRAGWRGAADPSTNRGSLELEASYRKEW
jgi:hypothetical protein